MTRQLNILIVDDEEAIRTLLVRFLSKMHKTFGAATGEEAVELAQQRRFDVAFVDMRMPGMDGLDTLRALKTICPDTCIVIITGYAEDERLTAALREGAITCLKKPFRIDEIRNIIDQNVQSLGGAPLKILVVDDDEIFRKLFMKLDEDDKYAVTAVAKASDALAALKAEKFDICFIDIILPGVSGFQLYDECRVLSPETKVVLFTGSDEKFSAIQSKKEDGVDYSLKKPFNLDDVVHIIDMIEEKHLS